MTKQAVSITLDAANLLWLRAQTKLRGLRSLSETVDTLILEAREKKSKVGPIRSVVGTISIPDDDPNLSKADEDIRKWFETSLMRDLPPEPGYKKASAKKNVRRRKKRD